MDGEFFSRLRRNNLFTPDNPNPLRPPDFGEPINFNLMNSFRSPAPVNNVIQQPAIRQIAATHANDIPRTTETATDYGLNLEYKPTGIPEQFVSNILNPPERGFKFQDMLNKRDLALRGLDIKADNSDIARMRADTSRFSAETRRQLAELHDLPDSDKLRLLQEGKVSLQNLKDASDMKEIEARGEQSRKTAETRGQQNINAIKERGEQTRLTNSGKPEKELAPSQERNKQNNAARELSNTRPDLGKYLSFDQSGNVVIDPNTPLAELSLIKASIYGENKDKKLPSDKKKEPTKKNDPLGIR